MNDFVSTAFRTSFRHGTSQDVKRNNFLRINGEKEADDLLESGPFVPELSNLLTPPTGSVLLEKLIAVQIIRSYDTPASG